MKTGPEHDFPVSGGLQKWEVMDEASLLYTGILFVTLNVGTHVSFVPRTRKTPTNWPPILPDNTDDIKTAEEARLVTLGLESYSVTPDEERAGTEEVLLHPGFEVPESGRYVDPSKGVVFFTTLDEYEALADEALELSLRAGGQLGVPVSEIEGTKLAQFLLTRVIASPHFRQGHRRLLGR